ncbi:MAG: MFS transporter [Anaerolineaceae bacterium]|nr:MFS transporter [Anaerolineaceae bacterium]
MATPTVSATGPAAKKSFKERFFLALPGSGVMLTQTLITALFMKYYTDIIGLNIFYTGFIFLLYNIWNYLNNPFIGVFVDRFKFTEKRGKYVFLMRTAAPFMIMFLVLMTLVSPSWPQVVIFIVLAVELFIYDTAMNVFNLSYLSYFMLAAPTKEDRIDVEVPRNILANIFSSVISLTASFLLVGGASTSIVVPSMIGIVALNAAIYLVGILFLKEKKEMYANVPEGQTFNQVVLRKGLRSVFKMRSFWTWFLFSIFALGAMEFYYTPFLYFMDWVVKAPSNSFRSLMTLLADNIPSIVMLIALPFIARMIKKVGSKNSIIISFVPYILGFAVLFFTSSAYVVIFCYLLILFGRKTAGTAKVPLSAAIVDENEMMTGERKAGLITGMLAILGAPVQAIQSAVFLFTIGLFGYDSTLIAQITANSGKDAARSWLLQNSNAILGIRIGVSIVPIIFTLIGLAALLFFPYNKKREQEISDYAQEQHAIREAVVDIG